jgi:hypothetical protein
VSVSPTDCRFLLPVPVRRVAVADGLADWREAALQVGLELASDTAERGVDLFVARAHQLDHATAMAPRAIIVEGCDARGELRDAGYSAERYLARPSVENPVILIPVDRSTPTRFALEHWLRPPTRLKQMRNRAAIRLLSQGIVPPPRTSRTFVTIGAPNEGLPWLIDAAAGLGVPGDVEWLLTPGQGDPLSRGVFHLFPAGASRPRWALKFARVTDHDEQFVRDQRGLAVAASGSVLSDHAPRLIGRFVAGGLHASLETAATGQRLMRLLHSSAPRGRKRALIDEVAAWIVAVAAETRAPPSELVPEIERLEREVLPEWKSVGARAGLASDLPPVPAVAQHNDLGVRNLIVGDDGFTVLDWEFARRLGLPLWDLWYFLADATARLDGAYAPDRQELYFASLFKGELPASDWLFRWTRTAVEASAVPAGAVGAIATLFWLHHGLSHGTRRTDLERRAPQAAASATPTAFQRLVPRWLSEPELGPTWDRWQRAVSGGRRSRRAAPAMA